MLYGFFAFLGLVLAGLLWRDHRPRAPKARAVEILVDGSNVMWWDGDTPKVETLVAVLALLQRRGFKPGVIFDATAGHRLFGRYRDDGFMARALDLPEAQVFVVPKGESADRFLLTAARDRGTVIVTNDRYREWLEDFPFAAEPGRLMRGGFADGALWLGEDPRPTPRRARSRG